MALPQALPTWPQALSDRLAVAADPGVEVGVGVKAAVPPALQVLPLSQAEDLGVLTVGVDPEVVKLQAACPLLPQEGVPTIGAEAAEVEEDLVAGAGLQVLLTSRRTPPEAGRAASSR